MMLTPLKTRDYRLLWIGQASRTSATSFTSSPCRGWS